VAQSGSAFGWGPKGRWFKSSRPDDSETGERPPRGRAHVAFTVRVQQLPRGLTLVDTPPGEPQPLVRCERDVTVEPHPAREPRIPGPPAWHGICDRRFRHVRYGPPHHERGSSGEVFRHPHRGQSWRPWSSRRRPGAAHPSRTRRRIEGRSASAMKALGRKPASAKAFLNAAGARLVVLPLAAGG
jgi:hypothetical protein